MENSIHLPLLSIIVPVYKVEAFLEPCVNSIICQSFSDWELILIDDGSPDRCGQICDRYASEDSRIISIHQSNQGLSGARNTGLDLARGKYFTFLDSDDDIASDTFGGNIDYLEQHAEVDLIQYPTAWHHGSEMEWISNYPPQTIIGESAIFHAFYNDRPVSSAAWNKIWRRSVIGSNRFEVGKLYEDRLFMLQMIPHVRQLYISNMGLYRYYQRQGSILHTPNVARSLSWIEAEIRTIEMMCDYPDLLAESSARFMKTIRCLVNVRVLFSVDIAELLDKMKSIVPKIHFLRLSIKDAIWIVYIKSFGIRSFASFYYFLLKFNSK